MLRTAPVMDRRSAPLKQLRLLFLAGFGGRLGTGRQHMAMLSLRDWVGATVHLAEHETASGPFNLCCPQTPTNAAFTEALADQLRRPCFATVPRFALKVGAGKMAPELLGSLNVVPAALHGIGLRVPRSRRRSGAEGRFVSVGLRRHLLRPHRSDPPRAVDEPQPHGAGGGSVAREQSPHARPDRETTHEPVGDPERPRRPLCAPAPGRRAAGCAAFGRPARGPPRLGASPRRVGPPPSPACRGPPAASGRRGPRPRLAARPTPAASRQARARQVPSLRWSRQARPAGGRSQRGCPRPRRRSTRQPGVPAGASSET